MSIQRHHHMHQYSSNSIIMIVILTMHVLVILLEMCVCYMVTCIQLSMTPAGVTVTNLYTLVKHAPRRARQLPAFLVCSPGAVLDGLNQEPVLMIVTTTENIQGAGLKLLPV